MSNDFNYNANTFSSCEEMFACMSALLAGNVDSCSDYRELELTGLSILGETFYEVHLRELKRFIRMYDITRNDALRKLIVVLYNSTYCATELYLIGEMMTYLISGEDNGSYPKPSIPYDLLFNPHYAINATLEDEIMTGYILRGPLIDLFAQNDATFDPTPYGDWKTVISLDQDTAYPDPSKRFDHPERLGFIKARSAYLKSF